MRYDPALHRWAPLSVGDVADALPGCAGRWWLSGGWALDHWLGRVTRHHGDIDVSTTPDDLLNVVHMFDGHAVPYAAVAGQLMPWHPGSSARNLWLRARATGWFMLQVNVEDGTRDFWRYRRKPSVSLAWRDAVIVVGGVPTGAPATQLLWKSSAPTAKDEADRREVLHLLRREERAWLRAAIAAAHPDSPWPHAI